MGKVFIDGVDKFYEFYPMITPIITCRAGGKDNALAVAWHSAVSREPALYGVFISPKRYSPALILESGEFAVNFLPFEKMRLISWVGSISGNEIEKFGKFQIATEKSLKTNVPVLKDAYATYECKLVDHRTYGDHLCLVGEILVTHFVEEVFTEKHVLDIEKAGPALYLGADYWATTSAESLRYVDGKDYSVSPPSR